MLLLVSYTWCIATLLLCCMSTKITRFQEQRYRTTFAGCRSIRYSNGSLKPFAEFCTERRVLRGFECYKCFVRWQNKADGFEDNDEDRAHETVCTGRSIGELKHEWHADSVQGCTDIENVWRDWVKAAMRHPGVGVSRDDDATFAQAQEQAELTVTQCRNAASWTKQIVQYCIKKGWLAPVAVTYREVP